VVNVACSFGRPADRERRRAEATEACRRLGFRLVAIEPPIAFSSRDDLEFAEEQLAERIAGLLAEFQPAIVVSPSPHDRHHGHEVVGRAVMRAVERIGIPGLRWWMWGLWADLPFPNVLIPFSSPDLDRILQAMRAHEGEMDRIAYDKVIVGRATMNVCLGPERVFGFGSPGIDMDYAEVVTEVIAGTNGQWALTLPRQLIGADYEIGPTSIDWWLRKSSLTTNDD
jgi:LmbE family N-acetylglucosaminyl deacetylase